MVSKSCVNYPFKNLRSQTPQDPVPLIVIPLFTAAADIHRPNRTALKFHRASLVYGPSIWRQQQNGAAHGSYSAWLFSVCNVFVFPVFCFLNKISFTRDELLNIRQNTPQKLLPDFDYSVVLLDTIVGGAVVLVKRYRTRRRGKRASELVKLCWRGLRTPLPSIHLVNLRSLPNKTDKLLLSRTNKDFSNSAALCFMETWLNDTIPDSALHLLNFQLIRSDRDAESRVKLHGGGTCFYINERWCTDVTVLKKMCCSDLETLFINCKPFYSPREFCSFILVRFYIPPLANARSAWQKLAVLIRHRTKHPNSVLIILWDFKKANLSSELPKYRQNLCWPAGPHLHKDLQQITGAVHA